MVESRWKTVVLEDGKHHVVASELEDDLVKEMERRDCRLVRSFDTNLCVTEFPGVSGAFRTWQSFEVDGLSLVVPSMYFKESLEFFRTMPERTFESGAKYYKLHSHFVALTLLPGQRDRLIAAMDLAKDVIHTQVRLETIELNEHVKRLTGIDVMQKLGLDGVPGGKDSN